MANFDKKEQVLTMTTKDDTGNVTTKSYPLNNNPVNYMRKTIRNIMKKGYCACDPRFEMWEDSPSEAYNIFKGNRNYLRLDNCKGKGYITLKLD